MVQAQQESSRPVDTLGVPRGWFWVVRDGDLAPGEVRSIERFGETLTLFRTEDGTPALVQGWCPHLGASFAHGGTVRGNLLRCPFHDFGFDTHGTCKSTGTSAPPPRGSNLRSWPMQLHNGVWFAWHDSNQLPASRDLPDLPLAGWCRPRYRSILLEAHPQEVAENSVDLRHFAIVHGFDDPQISTPVRIDGNHLSLGYTIQRRAPIGGTFAVQFQVDVYGLGYSTATVQLPMVGAVARTWVLPAVTRTGEVEVLLGTACKARYRWAAACMNPVLLATLIHDVSQDRMVWKHKRYLPRPLVTSADGPLIAYRKYARQFYVEAP